MSSRFNDDIINLNKNRPSNESQGKYISLMKLKKILNNIDTVSQTNDITTPSIQQHIQPSTMQTQSSQQQPLIQPPMHPIVLQSPIQGPYGYQQPMTMPTLISGFPQVQNNMELSSNARMEIQNMIDRQSEITEKNIKEYVTINSEKIVSYVKELLQYNQTVEKANRLKEEEQKKLEQKAAEANNSSNRLLSVVPESITSAFNKIKNAIGSNQTQQQPAASPTNTVSNTDATNQSSKLQQQEPQAQSNINTNLNTNTTSSNNQTNTSTNTPTNTTTNTTTNTPTNTTTNTTTNTPTNTTSNVINTQSDVTTNTESSRLYLNNNIPENPQNKTSQQPINTENNTIDEDLNRENSNVKPLTTSSTEPESPFKPSNSNNNTLNNTLNKNTPSDGPKFDYNAAQNEINQINERKKQQLAEEQLNRFNTEMENLGITHNTNNVKKIQKGGMLSLNKNDANKRNISKKKNFKKNSNNNKFKGKSKKLRS